MRVGPLVEAESAGRIFNRAGIMPGRQGRGAGGLGEAQQRPEFDAGVADDAGVRRFARVIAGAEIVHHIALKLLPQVDHVHRDAQLSAYGVDVPRRRARLRRGSVRRFFETGDEVDGKDLVALLLQQMGGDHGVDAAADGNGNRAAHSK